MKSGIRQKVVARREVVSVAAIALLAMVVNLVWVVRDHETPAWDQANYLAVIERWRHVVGNEGLGATFKAVYETDPAHVPLYQLVIAPFQVISRGVPSALVANTLMFGAIICVTAATAAFLFSRRSAVIAAILTATAPMVYGLSRTVLVDILLVLLTSACVLAAVRSVAFSHRGWAVTCGAMAGLACLTKPNAPMIFAAPVLVALFAAPHRPRRAQLVNLLLAVVVGLAVCSLWYSVNLGPVVDYLRSATGGDLSIGTTREPLAYEALASFTSFAVSAGFGFVLVSLTLVAGLSKALRTKWRRFDAVAVCRYLLPVVWFAVPFAVVAVSNNQDIRFLAPGVPGLVVLAAGLVTQMQPVTLRRAVETVVAVLLVVQAATYVVDVPGVSALGVEGTRNPWYFVVPFDGRELGYARPPGVPDYGTPIVRALEDVRVRTTGAGPLTVCILTTHPVVNGNTLGYLADTMQAPITYVDLSYRPDLDAAGWSSTLAACPVALSTRDVNEPPGRVATLNRESGDAHLSPETRAGFDETASLPIGNGAQVVVLERREPVPG